METKGSICSGSPLLIRQCEYDSVELPCKNCEARGFVCDAESKVFGPNSTRNSSSLVDIRNVSSSEDFGIPLALSPIPQEMALAPDDYRLLHCVDTHIRHLPSFNASALAFNPFSHMAFIYSSKLIRYAVLAERAAWKYGPDHIEPLKYLQLFYEHSHKELVTLSNCQRLSVCYNLLAIAAVQRRIDDAQPHASQVCSLLIYVLRESCTERADHFLWILQVINGFLSLLKHVYSLGRPSVSSSKDDRAVYVRHIWKQQGFLHVCKSTLNFDVELTGLRIRPWFSLKISVLFQLLEFDVQNYWFLKANEDLDPDADHVKEVLTSLNDTLMRLMAFIPQALVASSGFAPEDVSAIMEWVQFPCSRNPRPLFRLSPFEPELLALIYHTAILILNSLADDYSDANIVDRVTAQHSAQTISDICSLASTTIPDTFVRYVKVFSLFFAGMFIQGSSDDPRGTSLGNTNNLCRICQY